VTYQLQLTITRGTIQTRKLSREYVNRREAIAAMLGVIGYRTESSVDCYEQFDYPIVILGAGGLLEVIEA
jgi:hypothetical protein